MHQPARTPKHCFHKPTGQGYVRLSGKTFYTGKWATEQANNRYDCLLMEWLSNGRTIPTQSNIGSDYWIKDLIADYWVHAEVYYRKDGKPTRELESIKYAARPLLDLYGTLPASEFSPSKLKVYREKLIESDLCRKVINQRVGVIKRIYTWAVEEEKVPGETAASIKMLQGLRRGRSKARESKPVRPVSESDMMTVLPLVSRQVAAMIELQWLTGMRPGEAVQMCWCDLDYTDKTWVYSPASHKTEHHGRSRSIPLGPKAQVILEEFRKLNTKVPIFSPIEADAEYRAEKSRHRKTKVQPSQIQRKRKAKANPKRILRDAYDPFSYRRAIHRACDKAGIARWSPNQLRHSAATRIRKDYGIDAARALLGHSSSTITEVYAELDQAQVLRIMKECG
ncbi:MAG: recombinase XerD [Planctomycetota bacterium]|nr:MAG: recombinase XerD [Planctomycetota bacterium]